MFEVGDKIRVINRELGSLWLNTGIVEKTYPAIGQMLVKMRDTPYSFIMDFKDAMPEKRTK